MGSDGQFNVRANHPNEAMTTYTLNCECCKHNFTSTCEETRAYNPCIQARARRMQSQLDYRQDRLKYHKEIHQKPIEEIADRLGCTPSQARKYIDLFQLTVPDEDFWTGLHGQSCPIWPENWWDDTDI